MDLDLMEAHAKKNGVWDVQITKTDKLTCEFHQPQNSDQTSWDEYAYYINGQRISKRSAQILLDGQFMRRMERA